MREKQEKIDYIFLDVDGVFNTKSQWKRMFTLDENASSIFLIMPRLFHTGHLRSSLLQHGRMAIATMGSILSL